MSSTSLVTIGPVGDSGGSGSPAPEVQATLRTDLSVRKRLQPLSIQAGLPLLTPSRQRPMGPC